MEVTDKNYEELLPKVLDGIDRCTFLAIDCEMSGLSETDEKENQFETVEERYLCVRESASKFQVLQFGISLFFYDSEKDEFTHQSYNFYTFPKSYKNKNAPNVRFLCESSSLEFLADSGFDFNKLIYHGIPYLPIAEEDRMRDELEGKSSYRISDNNNAPICVPEGFRKFMDATETKIKRFITSALSEMTIESVNSYQRKLIFNNLKPKYMSKVYFETIEISESEGESQGEGQGSAAEAEADEASSSSDVENGKTMPSRVETKVPVLRLVKLNEHEQRAKAAQKKQARLNEIDRLVGFSKVIRRMSDSGKVIVGHNMLLDVSHTIQQFVDALPDNLADFKNLVQETFPNLVDTKYMSTSHPFRDLFTSTVLFDLVNKIQTPPFKFAPIRAAEGDDAYGYEFNDRKKHEAGFDSFVTGCCFIAMCQHIGTRHNPQKARVLPNSPLVMPFLNKALNMKQVFFYALENDCLENLPLFLMRMSDIQYLNISGTDLTPSRCHVFYVTCPKDATPKSIQQIFKPFGNIQTHWKNPTSLFVSLNDKDQSSLVMSNIECGADYRVIPFSNYQKLQNEEKEKKRPISTASPERAGDIFRKMVTGSGDKSPPEEHTKMKRPKTE